MARTSWNPEVGPLPANKGGTHGGVDPAGGECDYSHTVSGQQAGNPGTSFPWEGADASPKSDNIPPLKSL